VTIHEYCNAHGLTLIDLGPLNWPGQALRPFFPYEQTDVLASQDGRVFVAINRGTGRFIVQGRAGTVMGSVDVELTAEQVAIIEGDK
jgi:hypothetical protein